MTGMTVTRKSLHPHQRNDISSRPRESVERWPHLIQRAPLFRFCS